MRLSIFFIIVILIVGLNAQFPSTDFEIVESIPVETTLGNKELRNTPEVWLEMISRAQESIDIEQFYISNQAGEPLEHILQAIEAKATDGVSVRIIAESNMAKTYPKSLERLDSQKNIEVRILSAFQEINGINHSKYFIVDNESVFIGSQNFDWRALKHIHEIGLKIKNKAFAATITEIFNLDWQQAKTGDLIKTVEYGKKTSYKMKIADETVTFFPTASPYYNMPENFYSDELAIIEAINSAKNSIRIQLLSYSPAAYGEYYGKLDNALRDAALRGVNVHLLLADWSRGSSSMPYLKSLQVLPNIDVKLSTIPEYSGGYISFARVEHCKMMTIDDEITWIGTSNWRKNYFYSSRNLGIIINSNIINQKITKIFDKSWQSDYTSLVDISKQYQPKKYGE